MIDASEFDRIVAGLDGWTDAAIDDVAGPALEAMADAVADGIRRQAARHRRTGAMDASIKVTASGDGVGERVAVTTGRVAKILVHGQRPHDIRAIRSPAMPIAPYGFASSVHHPGSAPDPFVARGVAASAGALDSITGHAAADLADAVAQRITEG